jgi:FkbM family methyltransferase
MKINRSLGRSVVARKLLSVPLRIRRNWLNSRHGTVGDVLDRLELFGSSTIRLRVDKYEGDFAFGPKSHLLRRILETGTYEPELADLFKSYIQPERDVIDVGSNVGLFTVLAAKNLSSGRVLAAEPTDAAFELLETNTSQNLVGAKVILYKGLVADVDGASQINVVTGREEYSSMGDVIHPSVAGQPTQNITVPTKTLDSLVAQHNLRPALIKVDVEGAEGMVFSGAEKTLLKYRPVIISEFSRPLLERNGSSPEQIVSYFERFGYKVYNPFTPSAKVGGVDFDEIIAVPK